MSNYSEFCGRCGKEFNYDENLGRLQCRQEYFIVGKKFSILADHMPLEKGDQTMTKISDRDMRSLWPEWLWTENDYIEIPRIKLKYYPKIDKRCLIDTEHFNNNQNDILDLEHFRCISVANDLINSENQDKYNWKLSPTDVYNIKNGFQMDTSSSSNELNQINDDYDDYVTYESNSNSSYDSSSSLAIDTIRIYRMDLENHKKVVYDLLPELLERRKTQEFEKNNTERLHFFELPGIKEDFHKYFGEYHGIHPSIYNDEKFKSSPSIQKYRREILKIKKNHKKKQRLK